MVYARKKGWLCCVYYITNKCRSKDLWGGAFSIPQFKLGAIHKKHNVIRMICDPPSLLMPLFPNPYALAQHQGKPPASPFCFTQFINMSKYSFYFASKILFCQIFWFNMSKLLCSLCKNNVNFLSNQKCGARYNKFHD